MEPAEKRSKLDDGEPTKIPPRETEFLDMNDDCILAILESLKIDDLYSLGSTCVRINQLAGDVFGRKYSDEKIEVHIEFIPEKLIVFKHPNQHAEKYFHKYFRSIKVDFHFARIGLQRIFQFINSKCCSELKDLELHNMRGEFCGEYGDSVKNQLAQLESIEICYFHRNCDIYAGILQYCKNIKCLSIIFDRNAMFFKQLEQFNGENHPHLKMITCEDVNANLMRSMVSTVRNLEYLKFKILCIEDINEIYDDLKAACDNGQIGQLELILREGIYFSPAHEANDIRRLAELRPLSALHNANLIGNGNSFSIRNLVNLTYLSIFVSVGNQELMETINIFAELPNLMELDMHIAWKSSSPNFYQLCLLFVQKSPKMKTMRINLENDLIFDYPIEVFRLDAHRSAVTDAVPLKIIIKSIRYSSLRLWNTIAPFPQTNMLKIDFE